MANAIVQSEAAALDFTAVLTQEDQRELLAKDRAYVPTRHMVLGLLGTGKAAMLAAHADNPGGAEEGVTGLLEAVQGYRKHLANLAEQAEAAEARLIAAACAMVEASGPESAK